MIEDVGEHQDLTEWLHALGRLVDNGWLQRIDLVPSISIRPGGHGSVWLGSGHSFVRSIAGVSASVPVPAIGQTGGLEGKSVVTLPRLRLGVQL
jgi:hypothetical protein